MHVIGLMSGTSLDGVDAAHLETDGQTITAIGPALTVPYSAPLRAQLRALLDRAPTLASNTPELTAATNALTRVHAHAVRALAVEAGLVGFHGQTILHRPDQRRTWQIGDAPLLARLTGLPIAFDFRSADVAEGGQGAPLAPIYHAALAAGLEKPLAVLNIGGVANITWIGETQGALIACDTGPGNALLDDYCLAALGTPIDQDGKLSAAGVADTAILHRLLAAPYFRRPAPKSLDRQDFAHAMAAIASLSPPDAAATLAAFTAGAVAAALPHFPAPPRRVLVCGGGRKNPSIMAALAASLPCPVEKSEAAGWDGDALEGQCFAFLAARVARGLPLSFPGTTGVARPCAGGRIVRPDR